jgi:hypothetical protein
MGMAWLKISWMGLEFGHGNLAIGEEKEERRHFHFNFIIFFLLFVITVLKYLEIKLLA